MDRYLNFLPGEGGSSDVVAGDAQLTFCLDERLIIAFFTDHMRDQCRHDRPLDETPRAAMMTREAAVSPCGFLICSSQAAITERALGGRMSNRDPIGW